MRAGSPWRRNCPVVCRARWVRRPGCWQRWLDTAAALRDRLPQTAAALARGDLRGHKAALIAEHTAGLDASCGAAVEARVLPTAGRLTPGQLRRALARAILAVDAAGAARRATCARAKRAISTFTLADGMAGMWTELPAEDLATVLAGLDADAAKLKQTLLDQGVPPAAVPGVDARRRPPWSSGPGAPWPNPTCPPTSADPPTSGSPSPCPPWTHRNRDPTRPALLTDAPSGRPPTRLPGSARAASG